MPIRTCLVVATGIVVATSALAQSEITIKSTEVVPGLYMLEGEGGFAGGNMGLMIGDDGVVLIDDGIEPIAATLLAAIEEHTKQSVDFVINTHVHGDHVGSNKALHMSGATVIAHDNIRRRLIDVGWQTADQWQALHDYLVEFEALDSALDDPTAAFNDDFLQQAYEDGTLVWP